MRRFVLSAAALVGLVASSSTASAQHNKNVISNSGNGIHNTVVAQNHSHPSYFPTPFGGSNKNIISNSGNGIGNTIVAQNGGGSYGGWFPGGGVFPGGVNVNVITNSGNGVGNTVVAGNRGGPGGLNINVITNSGNGVGNTIVARNR